MAIPAERSVCARLKTRQLMLLVQLAEHESVLRAARAACMSQSAASKLLHELEETIGAALFVRHGRGITITPYGEILVRHARKSLIELEHAYEEIAATKSGIRGHASIGTEATAATTLVPKAVTALKARFPQVVVRIEQDFSETLVRRLQDGKLDMVVARIQAGIELSGIQFEPLKEAHHTIVARSGHPLTRKRRVGWPDVVSQTWVVPPDGNVLRDRLTLALVEQGLQLTKQVVETASFPVIISLLQMSDMIAPLPTDVVRPYCESGVLAVVPVGLDFHVGAAGIVTLRDHPLSPGARAMLSMLRETAAQ